MELKSARIHLIPLENCSMMGCVNDNDTVFLYSQQIHGLVRAHVFSSDDSVEYLFH